jgi:FixJ family two-component response regulator
MSQVWIVDDDDEMLHALQLMLELLEHEVRPFRDARSAAKELLGGERPGAMILDINMPQVSGIDLLEFLRMREGLKDIPVVMLSTETADVQVDEALQIGANAFIFKPVTIEELEDALDKALATD